MRFLRMTRPPDSAAAAGLGSAGAGSSAGRAKLAPSAAAAPATPVWITRRRETASGGVDRLLMFRSFALTWADELSSADCYTPAAGAMRGKYGPGAALPARL